MNANILPNGITGGQVLIVSDCAVQIQNVSDDIVQDSPITDNINLFDVDSAIEKLSANDLFVSNSSGLSLPDFQQMATKLGGISLRQAKQNLATAILNRKCEIAAMAKFQKQFI